MATQAAPIFRPDGKNAIHDGVEHEPGGGRGLLDPTDSAVLLLDHQAGLFQTVKDIGVAELRANTTMLAKLAALMHLPVITTASEPNGPNGPLMPEIHAAAPHAVYVPRKGEVNAWDNQLFAKTVRDTGKHTLIMAGVWTSVCVMFPALDAKAAGFTVYAVMDASGDDAFVRFDLGRVIAVFFILAMLALIVSLAELLREIFLAVNSPQCPIV